MRRACGFMMSLSVSLLAWTLPALAEGDPEKGLDLAVERCARCHVIGDHNPMGGINSTPSFWIFARKPEVYTERLRTFDQRRPHIGIKLSLTPAQIEDVVTYVSHLEPK